MTDSGLIVSGTVRGRQDLDAAIWRLLPDGAWEPLGRDDPGLVGAGRGSSIYRLVPFAGGFFATGGSGVVPDCALVGAAVAALRPPTADHCPGLPTASWVSADGRRWQPVDGPRLPGRPRGQAVWIDALAPGGRGLLGLINEAPPAAERPSLGLWTSHDGVAWERIGNGMPVAEGWPGQDMIVLPGRVVVFGHDGMGMHVAVWIGTPGP